MRQYESYKCNKCGNVVEVQNVGGGEIHCCGDAYGDDHRKSDHGQFDESLCR